MSENTLSEQQNQHNNCESKDPRGWTTGRVKEEIRDPVMLWGKGHPSRELQIKSVVLELRGEAIKQEPLEWQRRRNWSTSKSSPSREGRDGIRFISYFKLSICAHSGE